MYGMEAFMMLAVADLRPLWLLKFSFLADLPNSKRSFRYTTAIPPDPGNDLKE
jgi:hypothetical protein